MKKSVESILTALLIASLVIIFKKLLGDDLTFAVLFAAISAAMLIAFQKYSKDEK